jgi:hypothetical protein
MTVVDGDVKFLNGSLVSKFEKDKLFQNET